MPAKLKVRIVSARHLPIMDRSSDLTDAFVEVKFGSNTYKTEVFRKSLNPHWNSDWYRFEVDDEDLQDEPLQLKVLDHDTYSSHDAIGKVYVDLNPLLTRDHGAMISGWFPIYDTMHGIRGELNVVVKIDLFSDFNKFRQSSCGVQFFCTSGVPHGYHVQAMHGFVEELVVNDDPEYQWIDKIRSQRSSNEARQVLFSKLSGELQRKIGLKVLETGGNAIIGYRQCFDLEGETGVVVRAIGTAVSLARSTHYATSATSLSPSKDFPLPEDGIAPGSPTRPNAPTTPAKDVKVVRRSSDSDIGTPPKATTQVGSSGSGGGGGVTKPLFSRPAIQQQSIEMLEYPFFTIKSFQPGFLLHLGGVVSARSIKLLDRIHNPDEPETRDNWWVEIRTEIMCNARILGCHAVVGYTENTSICDETIVLSAMGTAALVNLRVGQENHTQGETQKILTTSLDRTQFEKEKQDHKKLLHVDVNLANQAAKVEQTHNNKDEIPLNCGLCHVPYNETSPLYSKSLERCAICKRQRVPSLLMTTIEPPDEFAITGRGCLIQARICRPKKEAKGESNATIVCENLTFMEYELNKQLDNKLKMRGMNALFGLKTQVMIGERLIIAVATGTAVFASALPMSQCPKIVGKLDDSQQGRDVSRLQSRIVDAYNKNKIFYNIVPSGDSGPKKSLVGDGDDDNTAEVDMSQLKDTYFLEIDDAHDAADVNVLLDAVMAEGFDLCTTEIMPGVSHIACNLQMFTRIYRCRLMSPNNQQISNMFDSILRGLCFKLRRTTPCCLGHLDFDIEIHDEDEIQVSITGICMGVGEPPTVVSDLSKISSESVAKMNIYKQASQISGNSADGEDMLFMMEDDDIVPTTRPKCDSLCTGAAGGAASGAGTVSLSSTHSQSQHSVKVPGPTVISGKNKRIRYYSGSQQRCRQGIDITPLSYIPGGRIEQFLGHLNFFIIRETTSVRECGGLNGFMHSFVSEVMAICRSHVMSFGGNTLVAFQLSECVLDDNLHKNQSQSLVNVCGDVVQVIYEVDTSAYPSQHTPNMTA